MFKTGSSIVAQSTLGTSQCGQMLNYKVAQFFQKLPKNNHSSLIWKMLLFTLAKNFTMHLGYF